MIPSHTNQDSGKDVIEQRLTMINSPYFLLKKVLKSNNTEIIIDFINLCKKNLNLS
jgi:hypothetical protein